MSRRSFGVVFLLLFSLTSFLSYGRDSLPKVSEACEVLERFRGEYSYGGLGLAAESNDAELAIWVIFHSTNAANTLHELFPKCQTSGKAYVLAALQRVDAAAFRSLTNAFCQETGEIITGSGCIQSSMTRLELVNEIQKRKSGWAFDPSRKPNRRSMVTFNGYNRDVYEERHRWEQEQKDRHEKAEATVASNLRLSAFTNLFRVEEAREDDGSIYGTYFDSNVASEWSAHLLPREKLPFDTTVEAVFPKTNDVVQVGLVPSQLIDELKTLVDLPFLKDLDRQLVLRCVRIRAAGDRLHWDTREVSRYEEILKTGVPATNWTEFIVDIGTNRNRMISFYHPQCTDIYVVNLWLFESPGWREQYKRITKEKPKKTKGLDTWEYPDSKYVPVVNRTGELKLFPTAPNPTK